MPVTTSPILFTTFAEALMASLTASVTVVTASFTAFLTDLTILFKEIFFNWAAFFCLRLPPC